MSESPTPRERAQRRHERPRRSSQAVAAERMRDKGGWVEHQVQAAIARGDFDDLPGAGKPLGDLGAPQDRDWWLKRLVEREKVTGILPAPLQLRKDDAELDGELDACATERDARHLVEEFNGRVLRARYTPSDCHVPLVTQPRDVAPTIAAWEDRRAERRSQLCGGSAGPAAGDAGGLPRSSLLSRLLRRFR